MATVYINIHKNYDYNMAIIQKGYVNGLMDFVKAHPPTNYDKAHRQIMIYHQHYEDFLNFLQKNNCKIYTREKPGDWKEGI